MTDVPEHLLQRSQARRAALGLGGGDAAAAPAAAPAADAPAPATRAAAPVAAPVAAPTPAKVTPPKPIPPHVQAALSRKKIPLWAFSVLAFLPVWGWLYSQTLVPLEGGGPDQLTLGAETFTQCAGCHGATGGGGAGRPLNNGEVLKTFPTIEGQLEFVAIGSAGVGQGVTYGDPAREGGAHAGNSFNGSAMPAYSASLTQEQLLAVVRHEREVVSGEEVPAEQIGPDGELLHANGTPYLDEEGVIVDENGEPLLDASFKLATPIDYEALAAAAGG